MCRPMARGRVLGEEAVGRVSVRRVYRTLSSGAQHPEASSILFGLSVDFSVVRVSVVLGSMVTNMLGINGAQQNGSTYSGRSCKCLER